eukprot:scaffold1769_cov277-Prasinococcus_capsulatus_cf.AAC.1
MGGTLLARCGCGQFFRPTSMATSFQASAESTTAACDDLPVGSVGLGSSEGGSMDILVQVAAKPFDECPIPPDAEVQLALISHAGAAVLHTLRARTDLRHDGLALSSALRVPSARAVDDASHAEADVAAVWLCPLNFDLELDRVLLEPAEREPAQEQAREPAPAQAFVSTEVFDDYVAEGDAVQLAPADASDRWADARRGLASAAHRGGAAAPAGGWHGTTAPGRRCVCRRRGGGWTREPSADALAVCGGGCAVVAGAVQARYAATKRAQLLVHVAAVAAGTLACTLIDAGPPHASAGAFAVGGTLGLANLRLLQYSADQVVTTTGRGCQLALAAAAGCAGVALTAVASLLAPGEGAQAPRAERVV